MCFSMEPFTALIYVTNYKLFHTSNKGDISQNLNFNAPRIYLLISIVGFTMLHPLLYLIHSHTLMILVWSVPALEMWMTMKRANVNIASYFAESGGISLSHSRSMLPWSLTKRFRKFCKTTNFNIRKCIGMMIKLLRLQ